MNKPSSPPGQTPRPENLQQQQHQTAPQPTQGSGDHPVAQAETGRRQQQQADFVPHPSEQQQQRERQQHLVDTEDDPASDANTAPANHPNDE